MRILFLHTSTSNVACFAGSLQCVPGHEIEFLAYDRKFYEAATQMVQQNPSFHAELMRGEKHIPRERCEMDAQMLSAAKAFQPDVIIYVSAWTGDFLPLNETLGELNSIAPMVHFLCDGQDPPWLDQLKEFERRQCFSLTVNIDGGQAWPGGNEWTGDWRIEKALTLLTPVDIRHYPPMPVNFEERPFGIGYAGNVGGHLRQALVQRLQRIPGFALKDRHNPETPYPEYANFLRHCRVSVSTCFTGSFVTRHVKGRALEVGFAGGCLLEWANLPMRSWFCPRYEFFEYNSIDEAAEIAEWLAGHNRIAAETAAALTRKVFAEHTPHIFWGKVFAAIEK